MNKLKKLLESSLGKDMEIIKEEVYIPNKPKTINVEKKSSKKGLEENKSFLNEQIAYCGSKEDYDEPDLNVIGNGEGTAVHGYGFYFAQDVNVANKYRLTYVNEPYSYIFKGIVYNKVDICSNVNKDTIFKDIMYDFLTKLYNKKISLNDVLQDCENGIKEYNNFIKNTDKNNKNYINFCKMCLNGYIDTKKIFDNTNEKDINNIQIYGGQVLKVDIPEDKFLLDEQKTLSEQSDYVKNILYKIFKELNIDYNENMSGKDILIDISNTNMSKNGASYLPLYKGEYEIPDDIFNLHYENQKNVYMFGSLILANNGIKGISYIGNRDGRCYIIFDPNDIKVIDKLIKENNEIKSFNVEKNPKEDVVETYLKSSSLRFAFNPMNNDFIICDDLHNPIPLNESVDKYITGILSPNLVEITSYVADDYNDSKEIIENLLGKRFKKIFKNHYEIII